VATADLNGDGRLDLVTAGGSSVLVLLGGGDGSFGVSRNVASVSGAQFVAIGDLNGDGRPDLAVAGAGVDPSYIGTVSVLLGNGDGTFGPAMSYATGLASSSVAIGDVSGDANPDLVVANTNSGTVSVLLGGGGGAFAASTEFATGVGPASVALADLNADGKADVVVANSGSGAVAVLMGNGDGTFAPRADFATGTNPYSVAVADFNGDGRPDLVTANHQTAYPYPGSVSVLLGNGDGTFGPKSDIATGPDFKCIAVGDFDRDGVLDVAIACDLDANGNGTGSSAVAVLFGVGDGRFRPGIEVPCAGIPGAVASGDINADGRLDLVAVASYSDSRSVASVVLGNGDGTFGAVADFPTGNSPASVAIGDLNGDGKPDLVTANSGITSSSTPYGVWYYYTISVLPGEGDGTFGPKTDGFILGGSFDPAGSGSSPTVVTLGDVNGDHTPDAIIALNSYGQYKSFTGGVETLLGKGDAMFGPLQSAYDTRAGGWMEILLLHAGVFVTSGDLNGDHIPDLVVVYNLTLSTLGGGSQSGGRVWALLGHGDGTFAAADSSNLVLSTNVFGWGGAGVPLAAALGDFDGDGREDLFVNTAAEDGSGQGSVLLGNGNGTFGAAKTFFSSTLGWDGNGLGPAEVQLPLAVSDLNGDGRQDLVVWHSVFLGNGDGTFTAEPSLGVDPTALAIGDVNGDGIPDVAALTDNFGMLVVLLGKGDGTFCTKLRFGVDAFPRALAMGDVNGDGRPDLVTANPYANTISVLLNTGTSLTSVGPPPAPAALHLLAPRPNPSRARVQIEFQLPRSEAAEAEIFDVAGRRTRTLLANQVLAPGDHVLTWDGRDAAGAPARAGIYLIRVGAGSESHVGRVVLLGR
jgi:hypothetical protein